MSEKEKKQMDSLCRNLAELDTDQFREVDVFKAGLKAGYDIALKASIGSTDEQKKSLEGR